MFWVANFEAHPFNGKAKKLASQEGVDRRAFDLYAGT